MYKTEVPIISSHALASEHGMQDVIEFVVATINMPLSRVIEQRKSYKADGMDSKWLSALKKETLLYAHEYKATLYSDVCRILEKHDAASLDAAHKATMHFMQLPGIGAVKAGLISQMCGINVACIDRHNVALLGIDENIVKVPKTLKPDLLSKKVRDYAKLCRRKGAEYWWDTWCAYVAEKGGMNKTLDTAEAVSKYHVEAILL